MKGATLTEAIRHAVEQELAALTDRPKLAERVGPLQAEFRAPRRSGGLAADKAFFDELSGHG